MRLRDEEDRKLFQKVFEEYNQRAEEDREILEKAADETTDEIEKELREIRRKERGQEGFQNRDLLLGPLDFEEKNDMSKYEKQMKVIEK